MIITISGQYGSGGNEIGQAVADKLGYRVLDSQLVIRAREIFKESTGGEKPVWWPSRYNEPFCEEDDVHSWAQPMSRRSSNFRQTFWGLPGSWRCWEMPQSRHAGRCCPLRHRR